MKKIILLMIVSFFYLGHSQQTEFLNTTWYLTKVIHQSIHYPFIADSEVSYVPLSFSLDQTTGGNQLNFQYCASGFGEVLFEEESGNDSFRLINTIFTAWMCQEENNVDKESRYLGFFNAPHNNEEYNYGDFTYIISGESENRILTITNELGNQTVFGNQMNTSSLVGFEILNVMVYPNPVHIILNVHPNNESLDLRVKITDINGKLVLEQTSDKSIDVSSLQNGFYFITIENQENLQKITTKFIKK